MTKATHQSLEERVAALERYVEELQAGHVGANKKKPWRETVKIFDNDPGMLEIFTEAMKLREADRRRMRVKKTRKARPAKS